MSKKKRGAQRLTREQMMAELVRTQQILNNITELLINSVPEAESHLENVYRQLDGEAA